MADDRLLVTHEARIEDTEAGRLPADDGHRESDQEGFLVIAGECLAIVEGQERRMRTWDYLHCPPETTHSPWPFTAQA
jgi:glyoxylate utilization-related uncharacterized protein